MVGIDSVNVDDVDERSRPAHSVLLAAGIPIVEHLRGLDALPPLVAAVRPALLGVRASG